MLRRRSSRSAGSSTRASNASSSWDTCTLLRAIVLFWRTLCPRSLRWRSFTSPALTVTRHRYGRRMNERRRPDELDHHDLGAHSHHSFRLYGDEEVWISDIRGRGGASDPDVSVRNARTSGTPIPRRIRPDPTGASTRTTPLPPLRDHRQTTYPTRPPPHHQRHTNPARPRSNPDTTPSRRPGRRSQLLEPRRWAPHPRSATTSDPL